MSQTIRTLRHGDTVPTSTPRRYLNSSGYVRLRWKVGPRQYVEAYEHRVVMGLPPDEVHVHHRNHIRDDNRPENLELLDAREHVSHHGAKARTVDRSRAVEMYEAGARMADIATELDCDTAHLSRIIRQAGVETRARVDYIDSDLDRPFIVDALAAGATAAAVARHLNVSEPTVRRIGRESGWRGRSGRPPRGHSERIIRSLELVRRNTFTCRACVGREGTWCPECDGTTEA